MKRSLRTFCVALFAAAILISCDFGPQGIFSLLEEEVSIGDGSAMFEDRTVSFVLTFGSYYYAGIGSSLYRRPVAGGSWESVTVSAAPTAPDGEIYVISSAATDGTTLYLSYAPVADTIVSSTDGTTWSTYYDSGFSTTYTQYVQKLLIANGTLFAATSYTAGSSASTYTTYFSLYYDTGSGVFASAGVADAVIGCPSSIAYDTTTGYYYIAAGNTIYTGTSPSGLSTYGYVPSVVDTDTPVLDVYYDSDNDAVIASCTGYLYKLTTTGTTQSGVFGSTVRQLSCTVVVPSNTSGVNAAIVGVKPWGSYSYTGYYEYDASLNSSFSSVTYDTDYELITSNSNYVTTLDDYGIDGFYYDSTNQVLFARAVQGGLWSNSYDGSEWSKWDRE